MDADAFDEFYAASFRRVVGQVYALTGSHEDAQECVQEAFVRAWSRRRQLDDARSPEAWVRTTAYRLAVSRWRRTVRARRAPDRAVQQPNEARAPSGDHVALVEALKKLPEPQRRALVLYHVCDLSVAEVAAEVGAAEGTVKARLSRGRTALHGLLDDQTDDDLAEGASRA